jgi:hypothetical protein
VKTLSPTQTDAAKRLLWYEGGHAASAEEWATAAGRVYEKLHLELAPLVGSVGVQALFARSATLTLADFPGIGGRAALESSTKLREALRTLPPSVTEATAAALFAAFLALITTFIGERLTTEVLRRAWPKIEERATKEMKR